MDSRMPTRSPPIAKLALATETLTIEGDALANALQASRRLIERISVTASMRVTYACGGEHPTPGGRDRRHSDGCRVGLAPPRRGCGGGRLADIRRIDRSRNRLDARRRTAGGARLTQPDVPARRGQRRQHRADRVSGHDATRCRAAL